MHGLTKFIAPALLVASITLAACGDDGDDPATAVPRSTTPRPLQTFSAAPTTPSSPLPTDSDGNAPGIPELTGEIVETPSGLRYIDEVVGEGAVPTAGQVVTVHYTGWLTDGTKFDSSVDRGTPFPFPIGQRRVIAGWDEGVATMAVGGKRRLIIPGDLAYGPGGRGQIPPNATLIFDVEVLAIGGQ